MIHKPRRGSLQERVLCEWLGCEQPPGMEDHIHLPAEWVDAILGGAGMREGLQEQQVRDAWRELAGEFIATHSQPDSIRDGVLVLRVVQPAMRFHLEQMKPMLLERVRARLGTEHIQSVRFSLG